MQRIDSHNLFHRVDIQGSSYSAIDSGIAANGPGMQRMIDSLKGNALLVSYDSEVLVREITLKQIIGIQGTIHLVLDEYVSGNTMYDYLHSKRRFSREHKKALYLLYRVLQEREDLLPTEVDPQHILHSDEGLLILPESWSCMLVSGEDTHIMQSGYMRLNYPDPEKYEKQRIVQYWIAAISYRLITGQWPFPGSDIESYRRYQRKKLNAPLLYLQESCDPGISNWIDSSLKLESGPLADEFLSALQDMSASDELRQENQPFAKYSIDRLRKGATTPAIQSWAVSMNREYRLEALQKRRTGLIIGLFALVIMIAAGVTVVRNLTRDLVVTGLEPQEVVYRFYDAMNDLDHPFMSEATAGNAARSIVNRVATMFAVSRVRESTEMRTIFMPAEEWLSMETQDRPTLSERLVFGVSDFEIERATSLTAANGRDVMEYQVSYTVYDAHPEEDRLLTTRFTDTLRLEHRRRGWLITSLDSHQIE